MDLSTLRKLSSTVFSAMCDTIETQVTTAGITLIGGNMGLRYGGINGPSVSFRISGKTGGGYSAPGPSLASLRDSDSGTEFSLSLSLCFNDRSDCLKYRATIDQAVLSAGLEAIKESVFIIQS